MMKRRNRRVRVMEKEKCIVVLIKWFRCMIVLCTKVQTLYTSILYKWKIRIRHSRLFMSSRDSLSLDTAAWSSCSEVAGMASETKTDVIGGWSETDWSGWVGLIITRTKGKCEVWDKEKGSGSYLNFGTYGVEAYEENKKVYLELSKSFD